MSEEVVGDLRFMLRGVLGKRLVDVTCQDPDELNEVGDPEPYVMLMFEDGSTLLFPTLTGDDDSYPAFIVDGPASELI